MHMVYMKHETINVARIMLTVFVAIIYVNARILKVTKRGNGGSSWIAMC